MTQLIFWPEDIHTRGPPNLPTMTKLEPIGLMDNSQPLQREIVDRFGMGLNGRTYSIVR